MDREMFKAHARYGSYVLRHKYHVYAEGRKLGLGRWRLLKHDWQKFTPAEWGPYVRKFGHGKNPRRKDGGYDPNDLGIDFQRAWLHHWHRGSHHWEAHLSICKDGTVEPLPMPHEDRLEMLADWKGAGLAQGKSDVRAWYKANRDRMILHQETRRWVEEQILDPSEMRCVGSFHYHSGAL